MKISAVVITLDEEDNIKDCLENISWVDETVIIDSSRNEATRKLAKAYTDKIFTTDTHDFATKRRLGIEKAGNDWILFIDADERVTPELKTEILGLNPSDTAGYYINRKNFYLGKWVKHSGVCPDYHLRLFNKKFAGITDRPVHEGVVVSGKTEKLKEHMLHYSVNSVEDLIEKCNLYSTLQASEFFQQNRKISKFAVFPKALAMFLVVFFSRKGFRDKMSGFFVGVSYTLTNFLTHLKLLKLQNKI